MNAHTKLLKAVIVIVYAAIGIMPNVQATDNKSETGWFISVDRLKFGDAHREELNEIKKEFIYKDETNPAKYVSTGIKVGKMFRTGINDFKIGGSLGYTKGPTIEIAAGATNITTPYNISYKSKTEVEFAKTLFEASKKVHVWKLISLQLQGGLGFATGFIKRDTSYSATYGYGDAYKESYAQNNSKSWTGLSWELYPAVVFEFKRHSIEIGAGYSGYPSLEGSNEFYKFWWNPFGIRAAIDF